MKWFLYILTCLCGLAQDVVDVALYTPLTSNQIYALAPTEWFIAGVGCFSDAGITPAVDGDAIQQWNDVSANHNNLGQDTSGSRPRMHVNLVNGYPVISFGTPTLKWMTNTFSASNAQPVTWFVTSFPSNTFTSGVLIDGIGAFNRCVVWWSSLAANNSIASEGFDGSTPRDLQTSYKQKGVWYQHTHFFNGTRSKVFAYGKMIVFGNVGAAGITGTTFGKNQPTSNGFSGNVAEAIMFSGRMLNDHQMRGIELYMKLKYALSDPF